MESHFKKKLFSVCKLLEKHCVEYILIGGTAVALNGYYRISIKADGTMTEMPDFDVWYNPNYRNYFNILNVLHELGVDITEYRNEQNPNPKNAFFKLKLNEFTLDFLPVVKANIKFTDAYKNKETIEIEGIFIHFMSYFDLIEDKKATARKKDIIDIEQLKKIKEGE